ncbi:uncharacterized protein LOC131935664 [Physella acuta]|uniref:uncharacterized protein LOC131935664 n=1 Tax=Physella acuta TaxID=109671 RepID=UPI0027DD2A80|nr:uncharacterized protein LOC131935664 [Physella acuta]
MTTYYGVFLIGWNQYTVCVSIHMVTLIALERVIAVCFPFMASTVLTPFRIKCMVVTIFFSDGVFYIPRAFMYRIQWTFYSGTNSTVAFGYSSEFGMSKGFAIYNQGFISIVSIIIPTVIIILSTLVIIIKLTISYKNMKKMSSANAGSKRVKDVRSIKITLTICVCVLLFVLIPTNTLNSFIYDRTLFSFNCSSVIYISLFLIYQTNASINFIIYVAMSPKFYNTYKNLIYWLICY